MPGSTTRMPTEPSVEPMPPDGVALEIGVGIGTVEESMDGWPGSTVPTMPSFGVTGPVDARVDDGVGCGVG